MVPGPRGFLVRGGSWSGGVPGLGGFLGGGVPGLGCTWSGGVPGPGGMGYLVQGWSGGVCLVWAGVCLVWGGGVPG